MRVALWVIVAVLSLLVMDRLLADEQQAGRVEPGLEKVLTDESTGIRYHLEADGHHISATLAGKQLWRCDYAFAGDEKAGLYPRTKITWFSVDRDTGKAAGTGDPSLFLCVSFDSPAFGLVRKSDGSFIFQGQD